MCIEVDLCADRTFGVGAYGLGVDDKTCDRIQLDMSGSIQMYSELQYFLYNLQRVTKKCITIITIKNIDNKEEY